MRVCVAEILTELMAERGISRRGLAKKLDIPKGSVSAWCAGKKIPTKHDQILLLLKHFGTSYEYLMFGIGRRDPSQNDILRLKVEIHKKRESISANRKNAEKRERELVMLIAELKQFGETDEN